MIKKYLRFLTKATNQHGVHSPFVYKLVTLCIYKKEKKKVPTAVVKKVGLKEKHILLLQRLVSYLQVSTILSFSDHSFFNNNVDLQKYEDDSQLQKQQFDMVFIDDLQTIADASFLEKIFKATHNNSFFVCANIYNNSQQWEALKKHNKVKVTVDLFHIGLVFFRREQEKEHFKIRF